MQNSYEGRRLTVMRTVDGQGSVLDETIRKAAKEIREPIMQWHWPTMGREWCAVGDPIGFLRQNDPQPEPNVSTSLTGWGARLTMAHPRI